MWFWILGGSVAFSLGMIFLQVPATDPPVTAVNQYQAAMRVARDFQAHQYAPDELQMAESEWQKAMELWKLENQKWFWQRDYSNVIQTLSTAASHAEIAGKSSIHRKQSIIETVNKQLSRISRKIRLFEKQYGNLPLSRQIKKNLGQSGLLLNEATSAIDRGENTVAQSRLVKSEAFIDQSITALEKQLTGYFAGLAQWQMWVKDAINQSKRNRENVIIIDKMGCRATSTMPENWCLLLRSKWDPTGWVIKFSAETGKRQKVFTALATKNPGRKQDITRLC